MVLVLNIFFEFSTTSEFSFIVAEDNISDRASVFPSICESKGGRWSKRRGQGLRVASWFAVQQVRCSFRRRRFTDTGRRCRQENGDVDDDDGGAEVAWFAAIPRNSTHSTSGRHRRRTHEYVYDRGCPVLSRVRRRVRLGVDGRSADAHTHGCVTGVLPFSFLI